MLSMFSQNLTLQEAFETAAEISKELKIREFDGALGDSRKYPYHITGGILEFRGRWGYLGLQFVRYGGGGG